MVSTLCFETNLAALIWGRREVRWFVDCATPSHYDEKKKKNKNNNIAMMRPIINCCPQ